MQAIIVGMLRVIGGGFLGLAATVAWLTMLYSKARAGHHGRLRQSNVTHPVYFGNFDRSSAARSPFGWSNPSALGQETKFLTTCRV